MADVLFEWPTNAAVGTKIPKERFYAQGTVSAAIKEKFVSEIAKITWTHKLSVDTVNVPGLDDLVEIDVFRIDTKDGVLSDSVLTSIDKTIPRPLIFEITRPTAELGSGNGVIRMTAAHKQLSTVGPKLSNYFSTNWMPLAQVRIELPTAINLQVLYAALLDPLLPVEIHADDSTFEVARRLEMIRLLDREIAMLKRKLRAENQFNKKVEINRRLKSKQAQREHQR